MDNGDDRFERRLVEETSKVRVELAGVEGRLTEKASQLEVRLSDRVAQTETMLRQEMGGLEVRLSDRIAQSEGSLRREISGLEVKMERSMGALRSDVLKWAFAFWLGQLGTIAGIIIALLR